MLFKITNGGVSFGADTVLENVNFEIREKEKIAIVGRNGCGKTTLLKCISGEITPEEGTGEEAFSLSRQNGATIGHLKQISFEDDTVTLQEEIFKAFKPILDTEAKMQALLNEIETNPDENKIKTYSALSDKFEFLGGYTYKKEYTVMLKKFGFTEEDLHRPLNEFSGGQRTKIAFAKLLLSHPDVLLLDEPTNHLDVTAVKWLENYIKSYKSAVVIVSHDRMFIEKTASKVYEIEYGETRCYNGNYSAFEKQKRDNYQKQLKDHEYQKEEIQRLMRLVERFRYKATKAKMVQSKLKQIEHMKKVDKPNRYDLKSFHANFQPRVESVKNALFVKDLAIGYTPTQQLAKIDFELFKGQKLGVIGDNGIGKSTFLKTIVREIPALNGRFEYGLRTEIGYFNQQMAQYSDTKTVFDDFYDAFPTLNETEVRTALGSFLFSGEDVFKRVDDLSGGEKVRLALCKMFKKRPNFLILDEPTNHMDIVGKETLENMLSQYTGTVVVVSHDRYFINKIADKLLVFDKNAPQTATFYDCGYEGYERIEKEKQEAQANLNSTQKGANTTTPSTKGEKKTFSTPLKDKSKKQKRVAKLEQLIAEAEESIKTLNAEMEKPEVYSDYKKIEEVQTQLTESNAKLEEYSDEWLLLTTELEEMQ